MNFREMDPELILSMLEQEENGIKVHPNVLAGEVLKEEALFRNTTCPACGKEETEAFIPSDRPFLKGALLPNKRLRCLHCRSEFDPHTRLVTRATPSSG